MLEHIRGAVLVPDLQAGEQPRLVITATYLPNERTGSYEVTLEGDATSGFSFQDHIGDIWVADENRCVSGYELSFNLDRGQASAMGEVEPVDSVLTWKKPEAVVQLWSDWEVRATAYEIFD